MSNSDLADFEYYKFPEESKPEPVVQPDKQRYNAHDLAALIDDQFIENLKSLNEILKTRKDFVTRDGELYLFRLRELLIDCKDECQTIKSITPIASIYLEWDRFPGRKV